MEISEVNTSKYPVDSVNAEVSSPKFETTSSKVEPISLSSEVGSSKFGEKANEELENEETDYLQSNEKSNEPENVVGDVVSRLEKLRLGAKEPELSEEQLRTNDQRQEDEVI